MIITISVLIWHKRFCASKALWSQLIILQLVIFYLMQNVGFHLYRPPLEIVRNLTSERVECLPPLVSRTYPEKCA